MPADAVWRAGGCPRDATKRNVIALANKGERESEGADGRTKLYLILLVYAVSRKRRSSASWLFAPATPAAVALVPQPDRAKCFRRPASTSAATIAEPRRHLDQVYEHGEPPRGETLSHSTATQDTLRRSHPPHSRIGRPFRTLARTPEASRPVLARPLDLRTWLPIPNTC